MTDIEYKMQMDMLMNATRAFAMLSCDIPLDDLLAVVRKAETFGPILDPTKWIHGGSANIQSQGALISAAIDFRRKIEKTCKPEGVTP